MTAAATRPLALTLALIALTITAGAQSRDRSQTPDTFKWNLAEIYPSDAAWRAAKEKLAANLPQLRQFQGKLASSAASLADALEKQADFSKELTTAVLWLIDRNIDIRCVRLKPYKMDGGTLLLDVQQIIPLPETATFQTQIGVKNQAERQNRTDRFGLRVESSFRFSAARAASAEAR